MEDFLQIDEKLKKEVLNQAMAFLSRNSIDIIKTLNNMAKNKQDKRQEEVIINYENTDISEITLIKQETDVYEIIENVQQNDKKRENSPNSIINRLLNNEKKPIIPHLINITNQQLEPAKQQNDSISKNRQIEKEQTEQRIDEQKMEKRSDEQIQQRKNEQIKQNQQDQSDNQLISSLNENEIKELGEQMEIQTKVLKNILSLLMQKKYELSEISNKNDSNKVLERYFLSKADQIYVLKGIQKETGVEVAIKIFKGNKETYDDMVKTQEEIQKIKCNQFIIKVYEQIFIQDENICVQVLEIYQKSLMDQIDDKKKTNTEFSVNEITSIFHFAINSLIEIHLNGIIHYNIKPQNILKNSKGFYKLSDLGCSKAIHLRKKFTKEIAEGTYLYSSPEFFEKQQNIKAFGSDVSFETDIFSMGLTLLQVLVVNLQIFQFQQLRQGDFSNVDNLINQKFNQFYFVIKYYMLMQKPEYRLNVFYLRDIFNQDICYNENINKEKEFMRISGIINLYIKKKYTEDKNLALQYMFLAQMDNTENGILYALQAQQILKETQQENTQFGISFLRMLSKICYDSGKYDQSIQYQEQCIEIVKSIFPENILECAHLTKQLGIIYLNTKNYVKARDCVNKIQQDIVQNLPQNHPEVVEINQLMAELQHREGNIEQALEIHLKCLMLYSRILGENHPKVFVSLQSISQCYKEMKQYQTALEFKLKAYEQFKDTNLVNTHKSEILRSIGDLYKLTGDMQKSVEFFNQALDISKEIHGQYHIQIFRSLQSLAYNYKEQEDYQKSLMCFQQLLEQIQKIPVKSKPELPEICDIYKEISFIYKMLNDEEKNLYYLKQGFEMLLKLKTNDKEKLFFLNSILISCNNLKKYNLAISYFQKQQQLINSCPDQFYASEVYDQICISYLGIGDSEKGLDCQMQSLKIREAIFEENHQKIADSYEQIGVLQLSSSNFVEARESLKVALKIQESLYEKDKKVEIQIKVADLCCIIANISKYLLNFNESKELGLKSLNIRESISEEYDEKMILTLQLLSTISIHQQDFQSALIFDLKKLKVLEKKYQGNNMEVAQQLIQVGRIYVDLKVQKSALKYHKKGLEMLKAIDPPNLAKIEEQEQEIKDLQKKCNIF